MLNFKSVLYKRKYYCISYKLNFILSSTLFKQETTKYKLNNIILKKRYRIRSRDYNITTYDRFIFNTIKITIIEGCLKSKRYYKQDKLHRDDKPAIKNYLSGVIILEAYYKNNKLHNINGPAYIRYYSNGCKSDEIYYLEGHLKRQDGEAYICYNEQGKIEN